MKISRKISVAGMSILFVLTGLICVERLVGGGLSDLNGNYWGDGMGWQPQTSRQPVYISDGLKLSTGVSAGLTGVNWSININSTITQIECCRPTTLKQSWCNYNADDELCDN